jgi:hypothetical protein
MGKSELKGCEEGKSLKSSGAEYLCAYRAPFKKVPDDREVPLGIQK